MATKIDDEMVDDARKENKEFVKKNGHSNGQNGTGTNQTKTENNSSTNNSANTSEEKKEEKGSENSEKKDQQGDQNGNNNFDFTNQNSQPKDEFQEKFDQFFKDNPLIAGNTAVNLVDDLKANFFMVYAKKQGVEMPKEAFAMDAKTKEFMAFLVDHAIKGKMFEWVKKYPLVAALGVFGLSSGTTFLMIKMLASEKNEKEEMSEKIKALEKKLWEQKKASATEAEVVKEDSEVKEETDNVKEFINQM